MLGQTVSHYRVLKQLGSGGMGVVYEAEDISLGRKVALKFLSPELAQDPAALERFQREARSASALNHPNICTIHAIEQHEGQWFIAMELLQGQPLDRRILQPLTVTALLDICIEVADALDAAHQHNIIHRDIKPANIFISPKGSAKVLDFGLAKLTPKAHAEPVGATAGPTAAAHLTSPGTAVGTVAYMSPEQARGEELDARTDLFSFGAVMYQMATGKLPFSGNTSAVIFAAILEHDPAPIAELNPGLPSKLVEIIGKCLEKDRELRYQTAAELRGDLKRLKRDLDSGKLHSQASAVTQPPSAMSAGIQAPSGTSVLVAVARQNKLRAGVAVLVTALVIAAALFGVYSLLKPSRGAPFQAISTSKISGTHNARIGAMSPDGKYLAYVLNQDGNESLWLRHLASDSNVQIVAPVHVSYNRVSFSPDGSFIYYTHTEPASGPASADYDLYRTPVLGGSAQVLVKDIDSNVSFSPDGRRFIFERSNDPVPGQYYVLTANADGSDEKTVLTGPGAEVIGDPSWSPDGKTAVGVTRLSAAGLGGLATLDLATGARKTLFSAKDIFINGATWLPDGKGLAVTFTSAASKFSLNQVGMISYPDGKFRPVTADTNDYRTLSVSSDGGTIATVMVQTQRDLYVNTASNLNDAGSRQMTSGDPVSGASWTREGKLLTGTGANTIQVITTDGSSRSALVDDKSSYPGAPRACSDGHVVFTRATLSGTLVQSIWRVDGDGSNLQQLTHGSQDDVAVCTPDAKWVLYIGGRDRALMKIPIGGGEPQVVLKSLVDFGGLYDISPDGRIIAVGTYDFTARKPDITLLDFDSGKVLRMFQYDSRHQGRLRFTPDGKGFVYPIRDKGIDNLWFQPLDGGPGRQLTQFTSRRIYSYQWSMDGKQLALVRGDSPSDLVLIRDAKPSH